MVAMVSNPSPASDDALKQCVGELIIAPRPLKPQTERQLEKHLEDHHADLNTLLLCAAEALEDYELEILFGPQFTPTVDDRASLADHLCDATPTREQMRTMVDALSNELEHAEVVLPDGDAAKLTLHEVLIDRYVRLLRLEHAPSPTHAATIRETLPAALWPLAVALLCERGIDASKQAWFVRFVDHMTQRHTVDDPLLRCVAEYLADQPTLDHDAMLTAARALLKATRQTTTFATSGHNYWSPDVAQHHHYRGQGRVDDDDVQRRRDELQRVETFVEDLQSFKA